MINNALLNKNEKGPFVSLCELNFHQLEMVNGQTRLETRFNDDMVILKKLRKLINKPLNAEVAHNAGLISVIPDDLDWKEEIRLSIEERTSFSPDALTGLEANLRFPGKESCETKIFGRLSAWQNWIFNRPNASSNKGALKLFGTGTKPNLIIKGSKNEQTKLPRKIPNNVDLSNDLSLQRALEHWQPKFKNWWQEMGPDGFQKHEVYLRTAISVDAAGWASYGKVNPDYRWGIFLADPVKDKNPFWR